MSPSYPLALRRGYLYVAVAYGQNLRTFLSTPKTQKAQEPFSCSSSAFPVAESYLLCLCASGVQIDVKASSFFELNGEFSICTKFSAFNFCLCSVLLFEYVRAIRNVCFVGEEMWEFLCLGPGKPPMSLFDFKVSNLAEMREHKIRFRYDLYDS